MLTKNPRNFNCKDEELPIIATLAQKNLERDLADFAAYSPNSTLRSLQVSKARSIWFRNWFLPKRKPPGSS